MQAVIGFATEDKISRIAIISRTGRINGRGSDKYKWVSGLTADERNACRAGLLVLIEDTNSHHCCTPYKQVTHYNGKYYHRNFNGTVQA